MSTIYTLPSGKHCKLNNWKSLKRLTIDELVDIAKNRGRKKPSLKTVLINHLFDPRA